MCRHPIAIDIGIDAIRVTQIGKSGKGFFIRGFASMSLNESGQWSDETKLLATSFFKKILKDPRFTGKKAVIHLPPKCISSFPLNFQVMENESIEQIISGESRTYISSPPEDTIIDYPSLLDMSSEKEKKYRAIIVTTRKSFIESYTHVLKKAGFIIQAIDYDVNSLIRLHSHIVSQPENPVILCSFDNKQTIICAVSDKGILAERHILWGINIIIDKLKKEFDISNNFKAEHILRKYGLSYEKALYENDQDFNDEIGISRSIKSSVYQIITPFFEELIEELHKVTAYLRSDINNVVLKNVYLYGMAETIGDIDFFIERHLNIPIQVVSPVSVFQGTGQKDILSLSDSTPLFALALGLALRDEK